MQPRIGITTWLRPLPTYLGAETWLYTLGKEYVQRVQAAGGCPLLLPHLGDVEETLNLLDGLILSGGGDLHPESYGERHNGTSSGVWLAADHWEIALVRAARPRRLPLLGICRGMQVMAVALGGRLSQEIAGRAGHPNLDHLSGEAILGLRHEVTLDPTCALALIYGQTALQVNTIHHQAVCDAGETRIVGYGAGEVIEALQAREADWPAFGVQWHPEKMPGSQEDRLFAYIVAEARHYGFSREKKEK